MSRPSTLYYDGYDPSWVIGTGKPPPVHPVVHLRPPMAGPGPNRLVGEVAPFAPVPANIPIAHPHQPGVVPAVGKHRPPAALHEPHGQRMGRNNLGPQDVTYLGDNGKVKLGPNPHGVAGINPNPYLHPPAYSVHAPLPAVHGTQGPVPVVRTSVPAVAPPIAVPVPAVHAKGPVSVIPSQGPVAAAVAPPGVKLPGTAKVAVPTPAGLREVPVNALIKVVMFVPLHCDGCEKKWKEKVTDLPGFQGYDVERKIDRVSVFGHVSPSLVLSTIQQCVPRAQMWRL